MLTLSGWSDGSAVCASEGLLVWTDAGLDRLLVWTDCWFGPTARVRTRVRTHTSPPTPHRMQRFVFSFVLLFLLARLWNMQLWRGGAALDADVRAGVEAVHGAGDVAATQASSGLLTHRAACGGHALDVLQEAPTQAVPPTHPPQKQPSPKWSFPAARPPAHRRPPACRPPALTEADACMLARAGRHDCTQSGRPGAWWLHTGGPALAVLSDRRACTRLGVGCWVALVAAGCQAGRVYAAGERPGGSWLHASLRAPPSSAVPGAPPRTACSYNSTTMAPAGSSRAATLSSTTCSAPHHRCKWCLRVRGGGAGGGGGSP